MTAVPTPVPRVAVSYDPEAETMLQAVTPPPAGSSAGTPSATATLSRAGSAAGHATDTAVGSSALSETAETRYATFHELIDSPDRPRAPHKRYQVGDELGRGGMGLVMRCTDRDLRRTVAMKVLRKKRGEDTRRFLRFVQEAQITGQLEHPNIVPIHEFGHDDGGRPFFTMKLVDGRSLKEVLTQVAQNNCDALATFTRQRLLEIFLKICDGMAFAHAKGVIHRDLKPANIMLGNFGEVLVMDWGLARLLDTPGGSESSEDADSEISGSGPSTERLGSAVAELEAELTAEGQAAGTPAYMAPEQARGERRRVDRRSDVFALGAMLYEMLVLRPPYKARDGLRTLDLAREGAWTPLPLEVPAELRAIIAQALAREPEDRYQSVTALANDVRRFLAGFSVSVKKDSLVECLTKLYRRHRTLGRGLLAAILAIAVISTAAWVGMTRKAAEASRAADEQRAAEAQRLALESHVEAQLQRHWQPLWRDELQPGADTGNRLGPWMVCAAPPWTPQAASTSTARRLRVPATTVPAYAALVVAASVDPAIATRCIRGDLQFSATLAYRPGRDGRCGMFLAAQQQGNLDATASARPERWIYSGYALELTREAVLWRGGLPVASARLPPRRGTDGVWHLLMERTFDTIRVELDGKTLLTWRDPRPLVGTDRDGCGVFLRGGELEVAEAAIRKLGWAPWDGPLEFTAALIERGAFATAREELLVIARATSDETLRARLLQRLGWLFLVEDRHTEAEQVFRCLLDGTVDESVLGGLPPTRVPPDAASHCAGYAFLAALGPHSKPTAPVTEWPPLLRDAWERFRTRSNPAVVELVGSALTRRLAAALTARPQPDDASAAVVMEIAQVLLGMAGTAHRPELRRRLAMVWCHAALGGGAHALDRARQALALDSEHVPAWSIQAHALLTSNDVMGAQDAAQRLLELDPDHAEGHFLSGYLRSAQAQQHGADSAVLAAARAALERAVALCPQHGPAHARLAQLFPDDEAAAARHRLAAARAMLDDPATVLAAVGDLRRSSDVAGATALVTAALPFNPNHGGLRRAQAELAVAPGF